MTNATGADWTRDKAAVFAYWGPRGESAAEVTARLERFLAATGDLVLRWSSVDDAGMSPVGDDLGRLVAGSVYRDDLGEVFEARGFRFALSGELDGGHLTVRHRVGSSSGGGRIPANEVHVALPPSGADADRLLRAVVEAWAPLSASAQDFETLQAATARRGLWSPRTGRRSYLAADLGVVDRVPEAIRSEQVADGVILSADDALSPDEVADAMAMVLGDNGIGDIPH